MVKLVLTSSGMFKTNLKHWISSLQTRYSSHWSENIFNPMWLMTPIAPRKVINIGSTNDLVPLSTSSMLVMVIGIDTKIEVIVVSPTTWEAYHSPRAKPEGCGELPRSLVTPQWPKSRYQFRFYHDAPKYIKFMQIRVCISRKSFIKPLQISHYGKHGHRPLSQQLP